MGRTVRRREFETVCDCCQEQQLTNDVLFVIHRVDGAAIDGYYRAEWCPDCVLRELEAHRKEEGGSR